jgi:hypothetical protein
MWGIWATGGWIIVSRLHSLNNGAGFTPKDAGSRILAFTTLHDIVSSVIWKGWGEERRQKKKKEEKRSVPWHKSKSLAWVPNLTTPYPIYCSNIRSCHPLSAASEQGPLHCWNAILAMFPFSWSFWHYSTAVPPTRSSSSFFTPPHPGVKANFLFFRRISHSASSLSIWLQWKKKTTITWVAYKQ